MTLKNKAQEDIAGFVIILVVVMVILLIFLAIFIASNKSKSTEDSVELAQFLNTLIQFTTPCASYEPAYYSVADLIAKCDECNSCTCTNGEKVCDVLNKTIKEAIEDTFNVGIDSATSGAKISGYSFNIKRITGSGEANLQNFPIYTTTSLSGRRGATQPLSSINGANYKIIFDITYRT